jgi:hypothetical protein
VEMPKRKPPTPCEHGKRKDRCVDCGGSGICLHGRQKARCVDCGGSGICLHGRQKATCVDCGGSGICLHGRRKPCADNTAAKPFASTRGSSAIVKSVPAVPSAVTGSGSVNADCGGTGVCVHGKSKYRCKECGGRGICAHNRQKAKCRECVGSSGICSHGMRKGDCSIMMCQRAAAC